MKAQQSKWLYLKVGLYGVVLYCVVAVMQHVKSPSFSNNVDVLIGSPSQSRHLEWCSETVQVVLIIPKEQTVREPKSIQQLCRLAYSSYSSEEVTKIQWSSFMKSMNDKGEEVVLEADTSRTFVRQGSLIYKVEGLKTQMSALGLAID